MIGLRFIRFLICGGVAACLNWGSRFFFSQFYPLEIAVILAFIIGLVSGFLLMRIFVFEGVNKPMMPQVGRYIIVNLIALAQTLLITLALAHYLFPSAGIVDHAEAFAHLVGVITPVITSYFGHKLLTFR